MPALVPSSQNSLNYTTGVGVPAVVTLSGTAAGGNSVTQQQSATIDGSSVVVLQMRGSEYFLLMTSPSDTCQLSAGINDVAGNAATIDSGNTFTYTSWNAATESAASFSAANMGTGWSPSTLSWNSKVVTVSSSGLITANAKGHAIVEVRYPLARAATNAVTNGQNTTDNPQFIAALLVIRVN